MATVLSNEYKYQKMSGNVDFDANTFKIALMASGFAINIDTHSNWSDISASELAAGFGYVAGGATLSGVSVTKDTANDRAQVTWTNPQWTATGGSIGPSPGAVLYKSTGTPSTSTIIGYLDFGSNQTATDGGTFTISNVIVRET